MAEAGYPGAEYMAWTGIAAPAGTPKTIIDRLYLEIAKVLATPEAKSNHRDLHRAKQQQCAGGCAELQIGP